MELDLLYSTLAKSKSKPAILSLVKDHSSSFIPKSLHPDLPPLLSSYSNYLTKQYTELLSIAADVSLSVTPAQCNAVEECTRQQSKSNLWFNLRSGRVTASFHQPDLIMSCCYPEMSKFKTSATAWGCKHENQARKHYEVQSSKSHNNFSIAESVFFIHSDFPYIGASPEGLVECSSCGNGICEVKASFSFNYVDVNDVLLYNFSVRIVIAMIQLVRVQKTGDFA